MTDYIARRRLYLGAGSFHEKDQKVTGLSPAEADRLVASGAIVKEAAKKAEPQPENKLEPEHENKGRSRKKAD